MSSYSSVYVRNIVFGVEDGLVSTVGFLSGVAVIGVVYEQIVSIGAILIMVEAFSMGAGSLLSEHSTEEYETKKDVFFKKSFFGGVAMFFSYICAGFVPLLPYVFGISDAFKLSIGLSLVFLFILGAVSAKFFGISIWKEGLRMAVIGGLAIGLGVFVGQSLPPSF